MDVVARGAAIFTGGGDHAQLAEDLQQRGQLRTQLAPAASSLSGFTRARDLFKLMPSGTAAAGFEPRRGAL